jgi:DNA invertase Pin-like site-specific DNA recombinase
MSSKTAKNSVLHKSIIQISPYFIHNEKPITREDSMQQAVIYLRLSRDDGVQFAESESISSQRMLLRQFAAAHDLQITAEYVDDGISGMRWERPAFQALLTAIENGFVHTVLVKDLSRLSRDYLRIGALLEQWLPLHGARLIAVSDGVDTAYSTPSNDFSPIRALLNDWYARDISRKVRAALRARRNAGICTLATVPYGYMRGGESLLPDPNTAQNVLRIFSLCGSGLHCTAIAAELNDSHIPAPRGTVWRDETVRRMLKNTVYCGELRLGVTEKRSYKSPGRIVLPPQAAVTVSVPALVSRTEFDLAQQMLARSVHRRQPQHWLSGRVFCAQCGSRMTVSGTPPRLICAGRRRKNGCTNPSCAVRGLLDDLLPALKAAGFPDAAAILPLSVVKIDLSAETAAVSLRYAEPCRIRQSAR